MEVKREDKGSLFDSENQAHIVILYSILGYSCVIYQILDYPSLCQSSYMHLSNLLPSLIHMYPGDPKIMFTINLLQIHLAKQTWWYGCGLLTKDPLHLSRNQIWWHTFTHERESEWELNLVNEDTGQLILAYCLFAKLNWPRYNQSTLLSVISGRKAYSWLMKTKKVKCPKPVKAHTQSSWLEWMGSKQ